MKPVVVLSQWGAGGVVLAAAQLRARGLRSVLVSELPDHRWRHLCDDHVLMDWATEDVSTLISRLDQRGIVPVAVVNLVEPLIHWQQELSAHYGLPGAGGGLTSLASKTLVREQMRTLGLSTVRFCSDPAEVDFFPAIVKPASGSSASWLVRLLHDHNDLLAYQRLLAERDLAGTDLIFEEYLPGTEFSLDGPVVDGIFHPVLAVEKPDHDEIRHHDAGLRIHPPQDEHVRAGVSALRDSLSALCTHLRLDSVWLHVEGRSNADGRTELVEINPRFGGGMYYTAIREATGIDAMEAVLAMLLGEFTLGPARPRHQGAMLGWVDVEADEIGRVEISTTADDLRSFPFVIDADVVDGYQATDMEKENYFLRFAMTADSVDELRARAADVLASVDYRIVAPGTEDRR
ncbi:ATP-grasp domain-containing protein [Kineosporia sp. NBRC 101731]|uniref:ATP-grasp domain-containing protein n=1 Tax=Kineosporia sp. NBRC 101731 TaxID=3032199 RepID=UPI00249FC9DB|nr:ATP-grasp domain-containing protein [Kineosporia sp. NBRC 101731]GLY28376.1 carbamoyl phosphate synthase [Kineosporia sp. NBRC 101731]